MGFVWTATSAILEAWQRLGRSDAKLSWIALASTPRGGERRDFLADSISRKPEAKERPRRIRHGRKGCADASRGDRRALPPAASPGRQRTTRQKFAYEQWPQPRQEVASQRSSRSSCTPPTRRGARSGADGGPREERLAQVPKRARRNDGEEAQVPQARRPDPQQAQGRPGAHRHLGEPQDDEAVEQGARAQRGRACATPPSAAPKEKKERLAVRGEATRNAQAGKSTVILP